MKTTGIFLLWAGLYAHGLAALTEAEDLKAIYDKAASEIEVAAGKDLNVLQGHYYKALIRVRDRIKATADLEGLVQLKKEEERFLEERTIPIDAPDGTHGLIAQAVAGYQKAALGVARKAAGQKIALLKKYIGRASELKVQSVRREDIENGLAMQRAIDWAQTEIKRLTANPRPATGPIPPPKDAQSFQARHYKAFHEKATWQEAKKRCEEMGGHLASVGSKAENDFLIKLIGRQGRFWLGGTDEKIEGQWIWLSGELFEFTHWYPGEPGNTDAREHYLFLRGDGFWNDAQPSYKGGFGFICTWD